MISSFRSEGSLEIGNCLTDNSAFPLCLPVSLELKRAFGKIRLNSMLTMTLKKRQLENYVRGLIGCVNMHKVEEDINITEQNIQVFNIFCILKIHLYVVTSKIPL